MMAQTEPTCASNTPCLPPAISYLAHKGDSLGCWWGSHPRNLPQMLMAHSYPRRRGEERLCMNHVSESLFQEEQDFGVLQTQCFFTPSRWELLLLATSGSWARYSQSTCHQRELGHGNPWPYHATTAESQDWWSQGRRWGQARPGKERPLLLEASWNPVCQGTVFTHTIRAAHAVLFSSQSNYIPWLAQTCTSFPMSL